MHHSSKKNSKYFSSEDRVRESKTLNDLITQNHLIEAFNKENTIEAFKNNMLKDFAQSHDPFWEKHFNTDKVFRTKNKTEVELIPIKNTMQDLNLLSLNSKIKQKSKNQNLRLMTNTERVNNIMKKGLRQRQKNLSCNKAEFTSELKNFHEQSRKQTKKYKNLQVKLPPLHQKQRINEANQVTNSKKQSRMKISQKNTYLHLR